MAPKKKTKQESSAGLPGLDISEIERLLAFMEKHNLEQFEFSRGDFRVALKRGWDGGSAPAPARSAPASGATGRSSDAPVSSAPPSAPAAPAETAHIIKSPIVGTFFSAAGPDSAPFVKAGDHVKAGQVVCIVEAMKLMNEIEADVAGVIVKALVENAQPVEYGQPLFSIKPDKK
ncbi:MAG TPA: acetyl-CoA carboxylase biotin carboxyl carrier protein [Candidatus Acidoferrales bacterium]|jgi:acetyl-CoA carboxylase biotin carboxyl carrier protein